MDYQSFIKKENLEFLVNNNFIECGQTTWQVRNITSMSVVEEKIPLSAQKPKFKEPEPTCDLFERNEDSVTMFFVFTFFVCYVVQYTYANPYVTALTLVVILAIPIYKSLARLKKEKSKWRLKDKKTQKNLEIWNDLHVNAPMIYSLILETNAKSATLFYSFNEDQILIAKDVISQSMDKKKNIDKRINIETINVGETYSSLINIGFEIYKQSIFLNGYPEVWEN
jgi:hypothetical protein